MEIKFPPLKDWQEDVFRDIKAGKHDVYVTKAKRQVGKSILADTVSLYFALSFEKSTSVIIEPTLHQSRRVFKQIVNAVGGEGSPLLKSCNSTLLTLEFINGSTINLHSAEQREALRGMTVKKGILIIDEAAYIQDDIFEIVYPVVDANRCPILMISTPLFQSGEFYKKYMEGLEGIDGTVVKSYDWSRYDTSCFLSAEKLEYYRKTISPLKFRSEYLGEFISEGSYVFGDLNKAMGSWGDGAPKFAGIDWAVSTNDGNDETCIVFMDDDGRIVRVEGLKHLSPTQQVERLAELINQYDLNCVQVEMNSIGSVYSDLLKQKISCSLIEFWTTNDSKRRIIEQLISGVQMGDVQIPNEPVMLRQMQHFQMEKTKTGYTYNNDSRTVHDDRVLALAFCYDAYKNNINGFTIDFA